MSIHDVSRSADLNRSKYAPVDEDTSSPGVLQMEESESDSNRSPFHSDQEQKDSCESLSEGNYADEEDSQHMQDEKTSSRRSFEPVPEDKEDQQLVPDSASLPSEKEQLREPEESLVTQDLAKEPAQGKDIESEVQNDPPRNEKKFVGSLDVTELSDISDDENNFSNLSEEDKQSDKVMQDESNEKKKQSSNKISPDSTKSTGLNNASNDDEADCKSDETVPNKSNEKKGISSIGDKDRKETPKADNSKESKPVEKLGFEDEITNTDKTTIRASSDNVGTQPDQDMPAVYCNGFDSKDGEDEEEEAGTNLKETEETSSGGVQTEQTSALLTNVLRFDFIGENGTESGSSKASDTDCQQTVGKYDKQNEAPDGAKAAECIKEDSPKDLANDEINKGVDSSDSSLKIDTLEDKSNPVVDESDGNKNLGNSSLDNLPETSGGIKNPANSLYLPKCTVQIDPLPSNLIPKNDSFVILPRSELLKRTKPRKPAPKMIPVKKRRINVTEVKNPDGVPKATRMRRPKRRLPKKSEPIPVAAKRKRPHPRDRSGAKPEKKSFPDETKDLSKSDILKEKPSNPKRSVKISNKAKAAEPKKVEKKGKPLPRQTKNKLPSEKKPEMKKTGDKRKKFSQNNTIKSKTQPRKENFKAIPPKRITRSSQRNK